ncbi:Na+/Pi-cotransporter [Methanoculleus marisnigri JR1]|uniref:Na+/Pi-cotransporter n=1 Tax=Methanoculleus marisnigri (strain ATCC 35101 / DSM 1498 / JR1) TaxID=368407 RepID=A3CRL4_METMJ|nr:Na+/Pi-cotransporter [Methanoculleus marisnigri JR1]
MVPWELVFAIIPGLILFFYGIENFSREILAVAKGSFANLLGRLTSRPVIGALIGAVVTALVQSSAATTIITIGLVNAGTLSFLQSLGIIIGSNIGTTVTAQLVAFKMTALGQVLIPAGFLVGIFGRRYRFLGKPLFYFGLVLFSLNLISTGLTPFQNDPEIIALVTEYSALPLAVLIGFLFTAAVQSSSVTTGLVVVLAQQGLLTLPQAIPILLGANIGSTTTTLIASARMNLYSRRAAAAHFIFNLGGVLLILPFLVPFADIVTAIGGTEAQMVANAHLIFNLIAAAVFLLFIGRFGQVVERAVPGSEPEILMRTRHLEEGIPDDTQAGFEVIRKELRHAHEVTLDLFRAAMTYLATSKEADYQMVERLKSLNNYLDARIEQALRAISKRQLSDGEATEVVFLVRMSNEIERLGDLGADLGEFFRRMSGNGNGAPAVLVKKTDGVYRILDENIVGLGLLFPKILNATVAELRGRDVELQHAINERYREQLVSLKREGAFADSRYLEVLSIIEAANAKVRDLRKLAEQYSREKTAGTPSVGLDDPLSLRNPVAGDDLERVPDLPVEHRVPRVDVEEGSCGELPRRGDHDQVP